MINTLLENDWIPDFLIRYRIRKLNQQRLRSEANRLQSGAKNELIDELKTMPVAIETQAANFLEKALVSLHNACTALLICYVE